MRRSSALSTWWITRTSNERRRSPRDDSRVDCPAHGSGGARHRAGRAIEVRRRCQPLSLRASRLWWTVPDRTDRSVQPLRILPVARPLIPRGRVAAIMKRLALAIDGLEEPAVEKIAEQQQDDPFQVLIATMLSAQ